ncbi:unnamed protein product [Lactuca saligna]|uniref:No apical meristem-associated C-terminal domain-containing protein n=1 Tax=Lactuca saligna TaxID=75948 RepID=A0AA35ZKM5_LACSI|nr:unnamed protein product [Lactuca saligna]
MNKEHHSTSQVYSKRRIANKYSMEFNDIHMNVTHNPQSGANKVDVIAKCRQINKEKSGKSFTNEALWGVVRNKPKWMNLKKMLMILRVCPNEVELPSQPTINLLMLISGLTSTTMIHMKLQLVLWDEKKLKGGQSSSNKYIKQ